MDIRASIVPVSLPELKARLRDILAQITTDCQIDYTVVEMLHQFKFTGSFLKGPDRAHITIDFPQGIPRRFIDKDLCCLLKNIKENFHIFSRSSYKYTTPFEHHTTQTIFYSLTQVNFRIVETVLPQPQPNPLLFNQINQMNQPPYPFQPNQNIPPPQPLVPPQLPTFAPMESFLQNNHPNSHQTSNFHQIQNVETMILDNNDDVQVTAHLPKRKKPSIITIKTEK